MPKKNNQHKQEYDEELYEKEYDEESEEQEKDDDEEQENNDEDQDNDDEESDDQENEEQEEIEPEIDDQENEEDVDEKQEDVEQKHNASEASIRENRNMNKNQKHSVSVSEEKSDSNLSDSSQETSLIPINPPKYRVKKRKEKSDFLVKKNTIEDLLLIEEIIAKLEVYQESYRTFRASFAIIIELLRNPHPINIYKARAKMVALQLVYEDETGFHKHIMQQFDMLSAMRCIKK